MYHDTVQYLQSMYHDTVWYSMHTMAQSMPFAILLQSQRTTLHWSLKRTGGGGDGHTNGQTLSI